MRHVSAVLAKGMQTGARSLPKIMKGCHTNLSNQNFLPEAMGSVHVPLNATQQQQSLTVQTRICIDIRVIKCLSQDWGSTLQTSKKNALCPHLCSRALLSGGIIQPQSTFKIYHTPQGIISYHQDNLTFSSLFILPKMQYLLMNSADTSQSISTNLFTGLALFQETIPLTC